MTQQKLSVKWFGGISNLSIRRVSDKTDPKISSKHDGGKSDKMSRDNSVKDVDSCLHSPGYGRSNDMYTHVATVPRKERQKSTKVSKKKWRNKSEIHHDLSRCQTWDHVRDSPLLAVLSGAHRSALDKSVPSGLPGKTLPVAHNHSTQHSCETNKLPFCRGSCEEHKTTTLNRHSGNEDAPSTSEVIPVVNAAKTRTNTCAPDSAIMSSSQSSLYPSEPASSTTLHKDMYVVMDPIAEMVNGHAEKKTPGVHSRTLGYLKMRETLDSELDLMDSNGEYVKFSKDGSWLDFPSEKLRRELEGELKLDSSNLMSHGWYHGNIPWELSETLVWNHGDFLIRDSLSSLGDYVLTSCWNNKTLHFLISRVLVQKSESHARVQYTLEGEAFQSVSALVHFYVGNRMALTEQSGAQLHSPVNRTLPLRYLEAAFALANHKANHKGCQYSHHPQRGVLGNNCSGNMTDRICPLSPSAVHHKGAVNSFRLPSSPTGESPFSAVTQQPRSSTVPRLPGAISPSAISNHYRNMTQTSPSPVPSHQNHTPATQRTPTLAQSSSTHTSLTTDTQQTATAKASPSYNSPSTDSQQTGIQASPESIYVSPETDSSSSQLRPSAAPIQSYVERLCVVEDLLSMRDPVKEDNMNVYEVPIAETASTFIPRRYQSPLMPTENRPLEVGVLRRVKELLSQVDAKTLSKHITKADCMAARILNVTPEMQKKMGVSSGMELLTLPHGCQLRLDLLERFQTMSLMLAVNVLGCTGSAEERAALLHKAIEMAAELKSSMGNMFGFAAIMRTLELPQISRLEQTWMLLRQRHTEGAILYEKTLKPFMKRMNDGKESCAIANTSFPHVVPLLSLLERNVAMAEGAEPWETMETGVDVLMSHLEAARSIAQLGGVYQINAETKLKGFQEQAEVLELFLTEFEMRLLWGSRGAGENQSQRYAKFDQVLSALSNKLEPPNLAQ
ncbi:hypothetical protein DPEC_G00124450 [Dallia pectoralis]|uniref:Uncharacterized protein n=1 Tax=Dallia pectoralis TaxID=75939 RepID=A0ACC2GR04_DALPE|nr:hypothetical protein DPEC_G00124450 [Dallia pectoralis]